MILFVFFHCSSSLNAQVNCSFETIYGSTCAVLRNYYSTTVHVQWMCQGVNQYDRISGCFDIPGGCEAYVGANYNWIWQSGETFYYSVAGIQYNVSFGQHQLWYGEGNPPHPNSDGYINSQRIIELGNHKYHVYHKSGSKYVYDKKYGWCKIG